MNAFVLFGFKPVKSAGTLLRMITQGTNGLHLSAKIIQFFETTKKETQTSPLKTLKK